MESIVAESDEAEHGVEAKSVSEEETCHETAPKMLPGEAVTTPKAAKGYASVQTYQNLFGPMQGDFAHRLITLENMWGSEPLVRPLRWLTKTRSIISTTLPLF